MLALDDVEGEHSADSGKFPVPRSRGDDVGLLAGAPVHRPQLDEGEAPGPPVEQRRRMRRTSRMSASSSMKSRRSKSLYSDSTAKISMPSTMTMGSGLIGWVRGRRVNWEKSYTGFSTG